VTGHRRGGTDRHGVPELCGRRDAARQTLTQVVDGMVALESARVRRVLHALPRELLFEARL
jgi:hypothetical protein